jgi:hypothetical protein
MFMALYEYSSSDTSLLLKVETENLTSMLLGWLGHLHGLDDMSVDFTPSKLFITVRFCNSGKIQVFRHRWPL